MAGIGKPSTAAQDRGTKIHEILEQKGKGLIVDFPPTNLGRLAALAWPFVPEQMENEAEYNWDSFGVPWTGRLDLKRVIGNVGIIGDYKTTGRDANIKASEDFRDDVPALLYSDGMLTLEPQVEHVLGLWIYINVNTRNARVVPFWWPDCRQWVKEKVHVELVPPAKEMLGYHQALGRTTLQVVNAVLPKNLAACGGMGIRCDYAAECDRTTAP